MRKNKEDFYKTKKDVGKNWIDYFIALNFFFNFTVIVPLPYILKTIREVNSTVYGIVQSGLPIGMITGALLVKKISYDKLLKRITFIQG